MNEYFWDVIECLGQGELKSRLNEGEKKGMITFELTFCGLGMAEPKASSIQTLQKPEMVPIMILSAKFRKPAGGPALGFSHHGAQA